MVHTLTRCVNDHHGFGEYPIIIIITRPKPAYGRQGQAGLWGQDTDQAGTFWGVPNVSLSASGAPLNLEPLMNHENQTWKFYTAAGSDGSNKSHLWATLSQREPERMQQQTKERVSQFEPERAWKSLQILMEKERDTSYN